MPPPPAALAFPLYKLPKPQQSWNLLHLCSNPILTTLGSEEPRRHHHSHDEEEEEELKATQR
jgi:hypothetical protein